MLIGTSENLSQLSYASLAESVINSNLIAAEPKNSYQTHTPQWVEVLVDVPGVQGLYTYSLPADLLVCVGDIVSVPFGIQITGGIAIGISTKPPADLDSTKIRPIEDVVISGFFPQQYWELLNNIADYYCTDLMSAIRVALPPGLLGRSQRRIRLNKGAIPPGAEHFCSVIALKVLKLLQNQKDGDYSVNYLRNQVKGASRGIRELNKRGWIENYLEAPKRAKPKLKTAITLVGGSLLNDLTTRQKEILSILKNEGGEAWQTEFVKSHQTSTKILKALVDKGYIILDDREILRKEQGVAQDGDRPKELSQDQANALQVINAQTGYAQILLHGVTGSGKTEVYLQAIAPVLAQNKSALVLVPEIGLTPQLTDRFRARFGTQVCVYHSKLSAGERYDTWRQTIQGEPQVVIGTRSAIFAPLPNLGLIVLDEEHDSSFKQNRPAPTYHARKVANWRAELDDCPLILGSATPSLESLVAVRGDKALKDTASHKTGRRGDMASISKRFYLSLPARIASRPLPKVTIIDLRQELSRGNRSIFSLSLQNAIADMQERGEQGILFIPRRGHSTFVSCRSCGYVMECPDCDVSLSYHYTHEGAAKLLRCHYCNYTRIQPNSCPECSSPYLKFFGSGTQKVTQELTKLFPELKCIRFDSDTTRNKGAHRELITQFTNKEADILIGTQMLTKGLDIAGVTVVGIVAADGLLHRSDYRAAERAFQTMTQVAGRAGRGDTPGKVIVQTYSPEHPVIQAVKTHDYHSFSAAELAEREELNYPPYGKLILIKLSSIDSREVEQAAEKLADLLIDLLSPEYDILGPAPASVMRVARRYRWQILLKFSQSETDSPDLNILPDNADLLVSHKERLSRLRSHLPKSVSMTIDIDPINMD
ncbi:primosomal protein N' [Waterburya agarophytonicola K14]|uniref:Replication restart protein PriA n=1 Tax=Waterburya agarophytonicola KI4 TaxID=2874699 RepID=A0A964BU76_9CYAN|nr:primosomal protein N' [Waterburya agarophytonicola]MCC0178956.1 primosomal protein N' [Waterburya agarophytonicola KI4]